MKDRLEVLLRVFEPSKDQQLEIVQIKEKMNKIASAQQGILLSDTLDVVREKYAKAKNSLEVATIKATEPYPKAETYFADFAPLVIQKIFTDAEGKFSTSFRHDKAYTIFAEAEREYGGNREHYYWLINAPTNAGSTRVLLSNNNLVSEDPDGYLKIKPLPEIQSLQTP